MSSNMLIKSVIFQATLAVTTIAVFAACGEIGPDKKVGGKSITSIRSAKPGSQKNGGGFASTDDVVSAIEEAKRIVPFVLNSLEVDKAWTPEKVLVENRQNCPQDSAQNSSDLCLSIPEIQSKYGKTELINRLVAELAVKFSANNLDAAGIKKMNAEIFSQLPQDPKAALFAEVEMLYSNSHPETGVLRNALESVHQDLAKKEDWKVICTDLQTAQDRAGRMVDNQTSTNSRKTALKVLNRTLESERKSLLTLVSSTKKYCADLKENTSFESHEELEADLAAGLESLNKIYTGAKYARDLLRLSRL